MKIKFLPQNIEVEGTSEKSLLQIANEHHLEIRSICKGVPSCAECRVHIVGGENNVLPPNKAELSLIGTNYFIDGRRLSCQVHCFGDVTVDLTEQVERLDTQSKKIRGFRSAKPMESKAVNDMMLLNEQEMAMKETPPAKEPSQELASSQQQVRLQRRPLSAQNSERSQKPQQNQGPRSNKNQQRDNNRNRQQQDKSRK